MIKLFTILHYGYRLLSLLFILCVAVWSTPNNAQTPLNVTCTANVNSGSINLGSITPVNADTANITALLSYECENTSDTVAKVSVCLAAGSGSNESQIVPARYMTGPNSSRLAFNMTLSDGEIWGDRNFGKEYKSSVLTIAGNSKIQGSEVINTSLLSGKGNVNALQGVHANNFDGIHTTLTVDIGTDLQVPDCATVDQGSTQFTFTVQATVLSSCLINATSDINLGIHSAGATNITSNNNIAVTCTNATSYKIGLTPSNDNTTGKGIMAGTNGKSTLPYQLQSDASGKVWGNNGTTYGDLKNGVIGEGNGAMQAHTVYVTVPNTDVIPDSYSDRVTMTVYY